MYLHYAKNFCILIPKIVLLIFFHKKQMFLGGFMKNFYIYVILGISILGWNGAYAVGYRNSFKNNTEKVNPRGNVKPQDGRGQGIGQGQNKNQKECEKLKKGPGYGQGQGQGQGRNRKP